MQGFLKSTITVLSTILGYSSVLHAEEVWKVTEGVGGRFTGTWTLIRDEQDRFEGAGKLSDKSGNLRSYSLRSVSGKTLMTMIDNRHCIFSISNRTPTSMSGNSTCDDVPSTWKAVASTPVTPNRPPSLLSTNIDPRTTEEYTALDSARKASIGADLDEFHVQILSAVSYIEMHNQGCLDRQFIYVKLQKPDWTYSKVFDAISLTCFDAKMIIKAQNAKCNALYKTTYQEKTAQFCNCYAEEFKNSILATPSNNSRVEIDIGVRVVDICRRAL